MITQILLILCNLSVLISTCGYAEDSNILDNKRNNYYISSSMGDNSNDGLSMHTAWKSLDKVNAHKFSSGDKILLKKGDVFKGMIALKNLKSSRDYPFTISSYQIENIEESKKESELYPTIDAKDYPHGIKIVDCSNILIENIQITANSNGYSNRYPKQKMKCGVLVLTDIPAVYEDIRLNNLVIKDVFIESPGYQRGKSEVRTSMGNQKYGWGIRFINMTKDAIIKDVHIQNCEVRNIGHTGIKITASMPSGIQNIIVNNNKVTASGGPGIQMSFVTNGHFYNNEVSFSGSYDDSRKWGRGSGLWTFGTNDVLIENNRFTNANGPGDSAGCHIDYNCRNIIVQYNYSANNAGGFCEILGNNYNCCYRYNVSVNDGYRVKGQNRAFQQGKTLWLSGYVGKNNKRNGPYNTYIYNNTIYVNENIVSKMAFDKAASGVLIMNNIFYINGFINGVLGDQYNPDRNIEFKMKNVYFENNLFVNTNNWADNIAIKDSAPLYGDPKFSRNGGKLIEDFIPQNHKLIKDKSKLITKLPRDNIGLSIGLQVTHDILGNPIVGTPDMGAIEIQ